MAEDLQWQVPASGSTQVENAAFAITGTSAVVSWVSKVISVQFSDEQTNDPNDPNIGQWVTARTVGGAITLDSNPQQIPDSPPLWSIANARLHETVYVRSAVWDAADFSGDEPDDDPLHWSQPVLLHRGPSGSGVSD